MSQLHVRVVTPLGVYKEFDTPIINIQTEDGNQGVLANHMPLVTMLKIGIMTSIEDGVRETYAVSGGLFYFRENLAEILTDSIENDPNIDFKRAELALKKALNRIEVKNLK